MFRFRARKYCRPRLGAAVAACVAILLAPTSATAEAGEASPSTQNPVSPVWVFFADKGLQGEADRRAALEDAESRLSKRCLSRRAKVRPEALVDILDVPLSRDYIRQVLGTGAEHRTTSRWLNAVSVDATPPQIAMIEALPFVRQVRPVGQARRGLPEVTPVHAAKTSTTRYTLDYGPSLCQVEPMEVPPLHDQGVTGAGVLVAVLDTGFGRDHDALVNVDVVAEWDFIHDDSVTSPEPEDDPNQHSHGTKILSLVAGFDPGNLIGSAFGASFALAKTEDITSETPVEEDYWVEAIEWADSLGADIVTSSLCYWLWYTYEDMDGDTAVTTVAGDQAVANGMVVLNAAGNAGASEWHYMMPASDGDSVLAVGAVDTFGVVTPFSSRGPTYDGRIKPDVMAVGDGNVVAMAADPHGYARESGTSCSCPLVAGVCALLLECHPEWTPMELAEALRMTATHAASPDSNYGWGLVRAVAANDYYSTSVADGGSPEGMSGGIVFRCHPNPSSETSVLSLTLPDGVPEPPTLDIYDVRGRRVVTLTGDAHGDCRTFRWDGKNLSGNAVPAGVYFARCLAGQQILTRSIVRVR